MPLEPSPTPPTPMPRERSLQQKSRDKALLDSKSLVECPGGIQGKKKKKKALRDVQAWLPAQGRGNWEN